MREEERNKITKHAENNEQSKMIIVSPYQLINILNVNGLNSPIKRYKVSECMKNKIQVYTVYKRFILYFLKDKSEKNGKKFMQILTKRE